LRSKLWRVSTPRCTLTKNTPPLRTLYTGFRGNLLAEVAVAPPRDLMPWHEFYDPEKSDWLFAIPWDYQPIKQPSGVSFVVFRTPEFFEFVFEYYYGLRRGFRLDVLKSILGLRKILVQDLGIQTSGDFNAFAYDIVQKTLPVSIRPADLSSGYDPRVYCKRLHETCGPLVPEHLQDTFSSYLKDIYERVESVIRIDALLQDLFYVWSFCDSMCLIDVSHVIDRLLWLRHKLDLSPICMALQNFGSYKTYSTLMATTSSHNFEKALWYLGDFAHERDKLEQILQRIPLPRTYPQLKVIYTLTALYDEFLDEAKELAASRKKARHEAQLAAESVGHGLVDPKR